MFVSGFTAGVAAETPEDLAAKARGCLAQLEGNISVPGLHDAVEVLRDRWGVPHIYAKNLDDLFFAQGFVAAQDRLFQIDMWRRVGVGETAEILGARGVASDRFARLLKYRGDMDAEWAGYGPESRRMVTAFTRGINAYIDHCGDRLPVEFQILGTKPKKWRPEDCLGRMSGIIMTRTFRDEIGRAELIQAIGLAKARFVAPTDPVRECAPPPGLDLKGIDRSILAEFETATRSLLFESGAAGSNNWVVDGTRSESGKPLLASDPHRPINLPSLRYLVHLHAPGWNVIGSGEPALPGVAIGHNEHVAWGFTIVNADQTDLYVEETHPQNPTQYRVGQNWEKMTVVRERVAVRDEAEPATVELRFTRHGPVLHQDEKNNRAYVLRWSGSEPGTAGYLGCLALGPTRSAREFRDALRFWKLPNENMVFADVAGNIGWLAAGLVPRRQGWDGLLPVPGADRKYEWQGFLPLDDLPQTMNPANHTIATANHNTLPPGYRHAIGYDWAPPYRFLRIQERLAAKEKFTADDFKSMQLDGVSLAGRSLTRLIREATFTEPELRSLAETLAGWDGNLRRDRAAGAIYAVWLGELQAEFFRRHVPDQLLRVVNVARNVPVMIAALEMPTVEWFGDNPVEARNRLLKDTFTAAARKLRALLGNDPESWTWGKLHTVTFRHPLSPLGTDYVKAFNLGPLPRPGDGLTPNAASYNTKYEQISGATYRHVFDLADWDKGWATSAPGQSGQPGSPHYADLLPLWDKGDYFPLVFTRPAVEKATRHRLVLKPG